MTQQSLFERQNHDGQATYKACDVQKQELDRVSANIGDLVIRFLKQKGKGAEFTTSELYLFCLESVEHLAPGSSCRVLRDLKAKNQIDYSLVDRSTSRYRIEAV